MKIIPNDIIPFKGFVAVNLFGVLFVRSEHACQVDGDLLNHEAIHTAQMRELLWLPFYAIYLIEWIVRLFLDGNAYRNISFEREAYENESDPEYLAQRKPFSMWRKKVKC